MPEQQRLNFSATPHTVGSLLWWRRIDCCPFGGNTHLLVLVHLAFLRIHHSWCYPSVFCGFFTSRLSWCCFITEAQIFFAAWALQYLLGLSESKATRTFAFPQSSRWIQLRHILGGHTLERPESIALARWFYFPENRHCRPLGFWLGFASERFGLIFLWCWRWVKRFHFLLRTKSLLPALQANCHQKSGLSCQECGPVTGTIFVPPFTFSFGVLWLGIWPGG